MLRSMARASVSRPLRTENIFVCCCGVGSDRVAGVGVSLGTLGLVRDDGRSCLGRCSHTTISRLRLIRPTARIFSTGSVLHAYVSGSASTGPGLLFRGPPPGTRKCHPRDCLDCRTVRPVRAIRPTVVAFFVGHQLGKPTTLGPSVSAHVLRDKMCRWYHPA